MEAKYNMTVEQNIFVAKRNIVDYIWKSAKLEGLNVTFPDTYAIYEQAQLKDVDVDSVVAVINLKHAWRLILNSINAPFDVDFICKVNAEVARGESLSWGTLRTGNVGIHGTDYIPPMPDAAVIKEQLGELLTIENPTDRAIHVMLWGMKSQLFWDGNKRTSMLIANKIMIENGCGILSVPIEHIGAFSAALCDYYSNDTFEQVKQFVYDKCIDGIVFQNTKTDITNSEPQRKPPKMTM